MKLDLPVPEWMTKGQVFPADRRLQALLLLGCVLGLAFGIYMIIATNFFPCVPSRHCRTGGSYFGGCGLLLVLIGKFMLDLLRHRPRVVVGEAGVLVEGSLGQSFHRWQEMSHVDGSGVGAEDGQGAAFSVLLADREAAGLAANQAWRTAVLLRTGE